MRDGGREGGREGVRDGEDVQKHMHTLNNSK